jgi:hypothetical protein
MRELSVVECLDDKDFYRLVIKEVVSTMLPDLVEKLQASCQLLCLGSIKSRVDIGSSYSRIEL